MKVIEKYQLIFDAIKMVTVRVVFLMAEEKNNKDIIIRNFLARSIDIVESIFVIYSIENYQDCWSLYRTLIDRLFHLNALSEDGSYDEFYKWSFIQQYEGLNKMNSDKEVKLKIQQKYFNDLKLKREEYEDYKKQKIDWKRPKAETVAKKMKIKNLYDQGYDYASTHIHPMANDGVRDFYKITGLEPKPDFPNEEVILRNSLLVMLMLLNEGISDSSFEWREMIFSFITDMKECCEYFDEKKFSRVPEIINLFENDQLARIIVR